MQLPAKQTQKQKQKKLNQNKINRSSSFPSTQRPVTVSCNSNGSIQ